MVGVAEPVRIVSACLAGIPCRYDGSARPLPDVASDVDAGRAVPGCPEMLGGLPTPRRPAEIDGGDGDDTFAGALVPGSGVTASLLRRNGITVTGTNGSRRPANPA